MAEYKFYMQQVITSGVSQPIKDLEVSFPEMKYIKATGLEDKGKPSNIYTEAYADSDDLRAYVPPVVFRTATDVVLTFIFLGENRRKVFNDFYDYIRTGKFKYWDTARNKEVLLVLNDKISPSDDGIKGSDSFLMCDFKFKNLYGSAKVHV